jgi:hypothetical protein
MNNRPLTWAKTEHSYPSVAPQVTESAD